MIQLAFWLVLDEELGFKVFIVIYTSCPSATSSWKTKDDVYAVWFWRVCSYNKYMYWLKKRRKPTVSWAASRKRGQQGEGGDSWFPLTPLSWDPTWTTAFSSGAPNIRRMWMCWSGSRGGPRRWSEDWSTSPMRTG